MVLAVGTDLTWAREGNDAHNISLTDAQAALIEQVALDAKSQGIKLIRKSNLKSESVQNN